MNLVAWINKLIDEDELWKFYKSKEFMKLRKEVLTENHFECLECKRKGLITKATTVHHIKHVREFPHLALDKDNLLPVCKKCHNELHNYRIVIQKPKLYIVTGLPGSGKTTYVKEHKTFYDIVYDLDYLVDAITFSCKHKNADLIINKLLKNFVHESMKLFDLNVYVIRTAPSEDEIFLFDKYNAIYIDLDENVDICRQKRLHLSDFEFNSICLKYKRYLNLKTKKKETKFKERW